MGRSKRNTGNWLITYSDLVTLLLVFFVVLYILTPGIDVSVFDNFISYFQRSVGVIENTALLNEESSDRDSYRKSVVEKWQVVEDFIENQNLDDQIDIQHVEDGVKVTIRDSLTFNSGSSRLLQRAQVVLREIADVFDEEIAETEVQGHTDSVPISGNSNYRSNWHLGAARGVSVVQFIQDITDLEPDLFKASSYGEYKPVAENDTEDGRRQNRRVEIYVRYKGLMEPATIDYSEDPSSEEFKELMQQIDDYGN